MLPLLDVLVCQQLTAVNFVWPMPVVESPIVYDNCPPTTGRTIEMDLRLMIGLFKLTY